MTLRAMGDHEGPDRSTGNNSNWAEIASGVVDDMEYAEEEPNMPFLSDTDRARLIADLSHMDVQRMASAKADVISRFQRAFSVPHVDVLQEDEFRAFLDFRTNRHWTGLHRQGSRICADMERLRGILRTLYDEDRPVRERLATATNSILGMGKAIATAILHVGYPERYGVWNRVSEQALRRLGLWPATQPADGIGGTYEAVNRVLLALATELGTDLWSLDSLLWLQTTQPEPPPPPDLPVPDPQMFGLEQHLHEFIVDNWDQIPELGKEWRIYEEAGEPEAGYKYSCAAGEIDVLAHHASDSNRWLVVELKRGQTDDTTVGQILRYMGWVKKELAKPEGSVEGLIIAHSESLRLRYALLAASNIRFMTYSVEFHLRPVPVHADD